MKKRIVIDGVIFGLQKAGGITRSWVALLQALDQTLACSCQITLLVPKNKNIDFQELSLKHIQVIQRRRFRLGKSAWMESLYLTLVALIFRPRIWYSTYYVGFPLFFSGKKMITLHDMISELVTPHEEEKKRKLSSLSSSDHILAISESTKRDLERVWPSLSSKAEVILHGYTPKEKREKKAPEPFFLFMGRRSGYKNFIPSARHILAMEKFQSYSIIATGGEERLSREEESLLLKIGEKRLQFLGLLPFDEVQSLLSRATLLLFPSLYEGFGFPVLEAFSLGVPVLSFRTSSVPEIVGENYPLADPKYPESLQEVAERLVKEREKWAHYAQERARCFTFEKMYNQFSSWINQKLS